jgi:serine/threonine protein kinase
MLAPDTILQNRYHVVRQIGQGGMGTVYEATDLRLGNTVALKQMLLEQADPQHITLLRRAFEREARLLASLRHPALPRVIDHFDDAAGQFLVMEFIPGDDLAAMQRKNGGPFPLDVVLRWADQLLDALEYLHGQQPPVIHRDIKPQNLKLTPRGEIILLDFGLAKGMAVLAQQSTTTASLFGYTPQYAPLEQIQGAVTDHRSDLYAFAATLYRLLTGLVPASALDRTTALVDRRPDPLRPIDEVLPDVPPAFGAGLMAGLALSAADRPASARAMRDAIHAVPVPQLPGTATVVDTVVSPDSRAAPGPRRVPWGALIAVMLAAVLGVLALLLLNREAPATLLGSAGTALAPSTIIAPPTSVPPTAAVPTSAPTLVQPPTVAPPTATAAPSPAPSPNIPALAALAIGERAFTRTDVALDLFVDATGDQRVFDRPKLFGGAEVTILAIEPAAVQIRTPEDVVGWIHKQADLALTAAPPPIAEGSPYRPGARIKIMRSTGIPLREAPQPNAAKLVDQLKLDQQATINDVRGDWLNITLDDGTVGWARWYYDGTRYVDIATTPAFVRTLLVRTPRLSGDDVHAAQQRLSDLGYREVGEIDGVYGPNTERATKRFQQLNGLDADGVIGPLTWEKLFSTTAVRGE